MVKTVLNHLIYCVITITENHGTILCGYFLCLSQFSGSRQHIHFISFFTVNCESVLFSSMFTVQTVYSLKNLETGLFVD